VTVTAPTGIVDGELLYAGALTNAGSTVTPPAGWTRLTDVNVNGSLSGVFWKLAASESGNYTFTGQSGCSISAYILRISGVDGSNPINASNTGTGGASTAYSISGVTTTVANTLLVQSIFWSNRARTISSIAVANGNPSWTNTQAIDNGFGAGQESDGSYTTAQATGSATATFSGSTFWGGVIAAITPTQPSKNTGGMLMGMVN
jgi:hypothetical protein